MSIFDEPNNPPIQVETLVAAIGAIKRLQAETNWSARDAKLLDDALNAGFTRFPDALSDSMTTVIIRDPSDPSLQTIIFDPWPSVDATVCPTCKRKL